MACRNRRGLRLLPMLLLFLCHLASSQGGLVSASRPGEEEEANKRPYVREASTFAHLSSSSSSPAAALPFDYIIVGGGTAGCPLAATLSQGSRVLVLERGGSPYGNLNISYMQNFHISLADTSPSSPAESFISTDGVINARARVLGGGSCINAGFYSRASPSYVKKVGWDGELVNQSYPWVEEQIVKWPKLAPWQEAVRDGLLAAGVDPFNGYTYDHLYGTKFGGTIFSEDGHRSTAADLLASGDPDHLLVLLHATVQKIIFTQSPGRRPRAAGVVFRDENGEDHRAMVGAGGEVVVAAGAIGSPQVLILSGVGPAEELQRLGIPVVVDSLHVGDGMSDNPMNAIFIPTRRPVQQSLIQVVGITRMGSFIEASSGFGDSDDSIRRNHGIFSGEIGQLSTIPPGRRSLEAMAEYARNKPYLPREAFQGGFILEKIDGPRSVGKLRLVAADAGAAPSVTFNYFSDPRDLERCVAGVRMMVEVARSRRLDELAGAGEISVGELLNMSVRANVNLVPKHGNDTASLEQFCRDTVLTIWHYHGGCRAGRVVSGDGSYRVIGADGLRVVDGSTFSESPGTNPQATVMMLGRYMGVKMLRERGKEAAT